MNGAGPTSPPDEPRHADVRPQHEVLPAGFILRVLLTAVMVAIALCFATHLILRARLLELRPSYRFPERDLPPPHEVATVRQELFRVADPRPTLEEDQRAGLARFSWVDRQRGIVRLPIETAMALVARRGGARQAP